MQGLATYLCDITGIFLTLVGDTQGTGCASGLEADHGFFFQHVRLISPSDHKIKCFSTPCVTAAVVQINIQVHLILSVLTTYKNVIKGQGTALSPE